MSQKPLKKPKEASGFFWSERYPNRYFVLILDRARHEWRIKYDRNGERERVRRTYVRQYEATTVRELREKAARGGWTLPRKTGALCRAKVHPL